MKLIIGGDISVKNSVELFAQKKTNELFNDVPTAFSGADEVIVNLECAVTDSENAIKKCGPNLKAPVGTCEILKDIGVTVCALSNNHVFDYGKEGLIDTLKELDANGIIYTGVGENELDSRKNLYLKKGDKTICIVNVCEHEYTYALPDRMGARPYDPYDTIDDIIDGKKNADFVIVIYHGGKEHCRYPSPRLKKLCRSMIKHGADVVLCQHSHCIGCYEEFKDGFILYGQGNFHFVADFFNDNAEKMKTWNEGLLIELDITNKVSVRFIPVVVDGLGIRLADDQEKQQVLSSLEERSQVLANGGDQEEWQAFCQTMPHYKFLDKYFVGDEREVMAHYLDCEAHTDVWRELYKTYNATNEKD